MTKYYNSIPITCSPRWNLLSPHRTTTAWFPPLSPSASVHDPCPASPVAHPESQPRADSLQLLRHITNIHDPHPYQLATSITLSGNSSRWRMTRTWQGFLNNEQLHEVLASKSRSRVGLPEVQLLQNDVGVLALNVVPT